MRRESSGLSPVLAAFASIVVVIVAGGAYLTFTQGSSPATTQSTTTSSAGIQGVVTGYVTVGPAQPVCQASKSCNVNMTGYSLLFSPVCPVVASSCPPPMALMAQLAPSGHYSILLSPGNYTVTGLSPSCVWMGCASAFPKTITVMGGMQLVFDVNIDTGIR